jgi:sugar phosphate isomerase/epimerase
MKNKLLVSTGTMVGHENGFNYKRALSEIYALTEKGLADGAELMMLKHYYDKKDAVCEAVKASGVTPYVIHCEKEIGTMISQAAKIDADGKSEDADALYKSALELFKLNCTFGETLAIPKMVLHLWGGFDSDRYIEYNISKFAELSKIAAENGIRILVENIPSNCHDPLSNWRLLMPHLGDAGLIFDTRFGKLHEQSADILSDSAITEKIEHVHVSDFAGKYREFTALRPILHPGEGTIDFAEVFALLRGIGYSGSVTLESPIMMSEELDIPKIEKKLSYIKENLQIQVV